MIAVGIVLFLGNGATAASGEILSTAVAVAGVGQLFVVGGALLRLPERPMVPRLAISPQARRFFVIVGPGVIAGGLFQHGEFGARDTAAVAAALAAICAGLPGHVLEKVLGAVCFAHEDTRTPMLTALAGLATATILAFALFPTYGHVGIAAAIAMSGWVGAILLGIVLIQRRWLRFDRDAQRRLPLIVIATAIMGTAIYFAQKFLASTWDISGSAPVRIGSLVALVALGLTTYAIILHLTKTLRVSELLASFRRI